MTDYYHKVANSSVGRSVVNALNLPAPMILERSDSAKTELMDGKYLVGSAANGQFGKAIIDALSSASSNPGQVVYADNAAFLKDAFGAAKGAEIKLETLPETDRFKGLIFDASGITNSTELRAVYDFFHPTIRNVAKCGRIIVIGLTPEQCDPQQATAQKALEGFVRSVAKEVGKKGATAQLVYADQILTSNSGAGEYLASTLAFLASAKSAYVDAQVIRVKEGGKLAATDNANAPLAGKVALVTGASRGIGEAIANVLARDGAKVVCLDVPQAEEGLQQVASQIGGEALALDITAQDAPEVIAKYFQEKHKGLDIIVHNAGVTRDKTLGRMKEHFWDVLMNINLIAIENINAKLLQDSVINDNGRIIGVASISGIAGNFGQTNYGASKAGVIGYVESMAPLLKKGITINAVAPGFIETQMTAAIPFTIREAGRRMNSLSQGGQPRDVAETIAYYAHPGSQGVTGNVVRVCGQSLIGK